MNSLSTKAEFNDMALNAISFLVKANTSDTEAAFLDLHLSISNAIVSINIYDKRDEHVIS